MIGTRLFSVNVKLVWFPTPHSIDVVCPRVQKHTLRLILCGNHARLPDDSTCSADTSEASIARLATLVPETCFAATASHTPTLVLLQRINGSLSILLDPRIRSCVAAAKV